MATIAILGTFDTKGPDHAFVAAAVRREGDDALLIDVSTGGASSIPADIAAAEVATESGEPGYETLLRRRDRGECVAFMGRAALMRSRPRSAPAR